jgi:hypothetical protein
LSASHTRHAGSRTVFCYLFSITYDPFCVTHFSECLTIRNRVMMQGLNDIQCATAITIRIGSTSVLNPHPTRAMNELCPESNCGWASGWLISSPRLQMITLRDWHQRPGRWISCSVRRRSKPNRAPTITPMSPGIRENDTNRIKEGGKAFEILRIGAPVFLRRYLFVRRVSCRAAARRSVAVAISRGPNT